MLGDVSRHFETAEEMYLSLTNDGEMLKRLPSQLVQRALKIPLSAAEKTVGYCDKHKIRITSIDDEDYPSRIKSIYNPPSVLFYKGDISGVDDIPSVAVCGTRSPSEYSLKVSAGLTNSLVGYGMSIISGFSEGVELMAMSSALKKGARIYGLIPAGINDYRSAVYMKYNDAVAESGAVISEYIPGTKNAYLNFGARNRLISAVSFGVCIVEAAAKSGSLTIVESALSQGREIFAVVPHDLFDPRYKGNIGIIRDGGIPLMGAYDIYREYFDYRRHRIVGNGELSAYAKFPSPPQPENKPHEKKSRKSSEGSAECSSAQKLDFSLLPEMQKTVALILSETTEPMRPDELSEKTGIEIDTLLTVLTDMEISGITKTTQGRIMLED